MPQNITPNFWFDDQARAAVDRYTEIFEETSIGRSTHYDEASSEVSGQRAGKLMTLEFTLEGRDFVALNGGPHFSLNPSISFIVNCPTRREVDQLWEELSKDGFEHMPLGSYPFSDRYGWVTDEFGVSWQIIYADEIPERKIVPSLMFVGDVCGRAEEAIEFYTSTFDESEISSITRYGPDQQPNEEGTVMFADFTLRGQCFAAMDSAHEHDFAFNEAVSFIVDCEDQAEVDRYWKALTADGGEEGQCGWLKDKFGVSWQVVPRRLNELLREQDATDSKPVTEALLEMNKIDIATLESAADA